MQGNRTKKKKHEHTKINASHSPEKISTQNLLTRGESRPTRTRGRGREKTLGEKKNALSRF